MPDEDMKMLVGVYRHPDGRILVASSVESSREQILGWLQMATHSVLTTGTVNGIDMAIDVPDPTDSTEETTADVNREDVQELSALAQEPSGPNEPNGAGSRPVSA